MSTSSPVQSDALGSAEYRSWVRVGILTIMGAYAISIVAQLIPSVTPSPRGFFSNASSELVAFAMSGVALVVHSRGRIRPAALLALAAVWTELHYSAFTIGSIDSAGLPALPVLVVGAALFVGGPGAIALAALTALTYPAAAEIGARVLHVGGGVGAANAYRVIILAVTLLAAGVLMHFGMRSYVAVLNVARTNERKFGLLVEQAPDGILLLTTEGRIVEANPAAVRLLGATGVSLHGRPLDAVLEALGVPPGVTRIVGGSGMAHRLSTGAEVEITVTPPIRTDDGDGVQVMIHDVTERRTMEREATQLGAIIDQALSEIYLVDPETLRFRFVNRSARLNLGYTADELAQMRFPDVDPAFMPERIHALLASSDAGDVQSAEPTRAMHRRKDGSVYPVELQVQRATFKGLDVIVAFALDVSARVAAEREHDRLREHLHREQRARAIEQIVAGVADDVRELYRAVGETAAALLDSGAPITADARAQQLLGARERGEELVRRLLAFARRGLRSPEPLSVTAVLRDMEPLLSGLLGGEHQLAVEQLGPDRIVADRSQLEQVIVNLVANARDAMPSGGVVRIVIGEAADGADAQRDAVVIEVRDAGAGMDEETQQRIFDPFFTTKPRGHGTGLGLATVQGILSMNDARIEVQSRPGWGTRMRIYWPATVPEGDADRSPTSSAV